MVVSWLFIIITWYLLYGLQGKIHCQFHRKNNTVIDKRIKLTDNEVRFDKGTYQVNPKRFSIKWFKLLGIYPYPMIFQEWKWDSPQPIDPTSFKNSWDSPEARQASDSEKDWRNMNGGLDTQLGSGAKQTGLAKYLPWITLGAVVLGLVFIYMTFNGKLGIIEAQIQSLGGMIQKVSK
jgi:hypothetical protein